MSTVERTAIRFAGYGAYVLGMGGAAASIGGTWGFLLVAVAGALPGGFLLAKDLERRGIERDIEKHRPAAYQQPPPRPSNGAAQAPEPLTPPSSSPF